MCNYNHLGKGIIMSRKMLVDQLYKQMANDRQGFIAELSSRSIEFEEWGTECCLKVHIETIDRRIPSFGSSHSIPEKKYDLYCFEKTKELRDHHRWVYSKALK